MPTSTALAPTPRDVVFRDGTAELLRFRPAAEQAASALPILLVPSMINRWYVLDLRTGASLVEALVARGFDVWALDWGVPQDEDRYFTWDDVLARLARCARALMRHTGASAYGLLGYCMGGTLCAIHAAQHPDEVAALVNLAGPINFAEGGRLAEMTDKSFFDVEAIAAAGNVMPDQMQSAFVALRPTAHLAKFVTLLDRGRDPDFKAGFDALEAWANDNVPFPAAAYVTYIQDLYQNNLLVRGEHYARGKRVDLGAVVCPSMSIVAERDTICPPAAATALLDAVGTDDITTLSVPGGHVGAVVGSKASRTLYPALSDWFESRLAVASPAAHGAS